MNALIVKVKKLYKLLPPLVVREIKERYVGSTIGLYWTVFQPLLLILLYWLVFAKILKIRIPIGAEEFPYLPFLLSGILPWFAVHEGILRGTSSIIDKSYIIKKASFPSELLTISVVISSFVHNGIGFLIFLIAFFIISGSVHALQIGIILGLLLLQLMLTIGLSLILSSLAVYIRDILQIISVLMLALFYMTTVLYPINVVPENLRNIIILNPFTSLIEGYHNVILYGTPPHLSYVIYISFVTVICLGFGRFLFRRLKSGFADVL